MGGTEFRSGACCGGTGHLLGMDFWLDGVVGVYMWMDGWRYDSMFEFAEENQEEVMFSNDMCVDRERTNRVGRPLSFTVGAFCVTTTAT